MSALILFSNGNPGKLIRVSTTTLNEIDSVQLSSGEVFGGTNSAGEAFAVVNNAPTVIDRVDVSAGTLTRTSVALPTDTSPSYNFARGLTRYGSHLFITTNAGHLVKVPLTTMSQAAATPTTLSATDFSAVLIGTESGAQVVFGAGDFVYMGIRTGARALTLTKFDAKLSSADAPTVVGSYSAGTPEGPTAIAPSAATDGQFAYFVTEGDPARLWKVNLRTDSTSAAPEISGSIDLEQRIVDDSSDRSKSPGMAIKGQSLYISSNVTGQDSVLLHVDLGSFSVTDSRTLTGIRAVNSLTIDGPNMYLASRFTRKAYKLPV